MTNNQQKGYIRLHEHDPSRFVVRDSLKRSLVPGGAGLDEGGFGTRRL